MGELCTGKMTLKIQTPARRSCWSSPLQAGPKVNWGGYWGRRRGRESPSRVGKLLGNETSIVLQGPPPSVTRSTTAPSDWMLRVSFNPTRCKHFGRSPRSIKPIMVPRRWSRFKAPPLSFLQDRMIKTSSGNFRRREEGGRGGCGGFKATPPTTPPHPISTLVKIDAQDGRAGRR